MKHQPQNNRCKSTLDDGWFWLWLQNAKLFQQHNLLLRMPVWQTLSIVSMDPTRRFFSSPVSWLQPHLSVWLLCGLWAKLVSGHR